MSANKTEYSNKVVVITGGAKGIGACVAHTFMKFGVHVVFSDVDEAAGKEREKLLNATVGDARAKFYLTDLSDAKQTEHFCEEVINTHDHVDILINNAGIFTHTQLSKRPLSEWDKVIAVNLRATYLCSQFLAESLANAKGNIINIASTRALMSEVNTEPYSASKGGIVALTHSLAMSLGASGIRVNCISPGWIDASPWQLPPKHLTLRDIDHEQHPVGRIGKPEDIAQACLFLGSNQAAGFITGHNLVVDGGMTKKMIYVD